jgi:hypothetical protein
MALNGTGEVGVMGTALYVTVDGRVGSGDTILNSDAAIGFRGHHTQLGILALGSGRLRRVFFGRR